MNYCNTEGQDQTIVLHVVRAQRLSILFFLVKNLHTVFPGKQDLAIQSALMHSTLFLTSFLRVGSRKLLLGEFIK